MNETLLDKAAYEGVDVDLRFDSDRPTFGDLFLICGYAHPKFPSSGRFQFGALAEFGFEQVDDYFGVPSHEDEGNDVKVWLSPTIGDQSVYHHPGPFDGIRLSYCILRNPPENGRLFLQIISAFAEHLPVQVFYRLRQSNLGSPPDLSVVEADMNEVVAYWRAAGIEPGSHDALLVDF